ncbi:hypothetical protein ANACOL_01942 [Anaerotruncus colihominis DSM 17241]|uniref:Uncharacterized protein n=1 Tax=Anaerotruncus colihominis DSM 17241 TaxID=445972 RepID=B0PAZ2_9FIRM|nr:hypothetical protein ANACOL_01942 [Anaerotruncus colihominis DSM 17241]
MACGISNADICEIPGLKSCKTIYLEYKPMALTVPKGTTTNIRTHLSVQKADCC